MNSSAAPNAELSMSSCSLLRDDHACIPRHDPILIRSPGQAHCPVLRRFVSPGKDFSLSSLVLLIPQLLAEPCRNIMTRSTPPCLRGHTEVIKRTAVQADESMQEVWVSPRTEALPVYTDPECPYKTRFVVKNRHGIGSLCR